MSLTIPNTFNDGDLIVADQFNANFTAVASAVNALYLTSPQTISADTTWSSRVRVDAGAVITVNTGVTLTINGPFEAGLYQVFAGAGQVIFDSGAVTEVYPEWWGAKGDGVTVDTNYIQAASTACTDTGITLALGAKTYIIDGGVSFVGHSVVGADAYYTRLQANSELSGEPAVTLVGNRKLYQNINIWFNLGVDGNGSATQAKGIQFGADLTHTAADQYSCNTMINCYVRNAYRSYVANTAGTSGVLWNNLFLNCRSDFHSDYGWYLAALVGSTTCTWINCMCNGVNVSAGGQSKGWLAQNIDDVHWINCQADDLYNGNAVYVPQATNCTIDQFRIEASLLDETDTAQFFYVNSFNFKIDNVKIASSTFKATNSIVIRTGVKTNSTIGNITFEACSVTDSNTLSYMPNLYKVQSVGTITGYKTVIVGPSITPAEVSSASASNTVVFANMGTQLRSYPPTDGAYYFGDILTSTTLINSSKPQISYICNKSGTLGTLSGVTATTTANSRRVVLTGTDKSKVQPGTHITITGVKFRESGLFVQGRGRVLLVSSEGGEIVAYMHDIVDISTNGADVSFYAPGFVLNDSCIGKGNTTARNAITPNLTTSDYGVMFMDTTLASSGKPLWWNGDAWVDATGAAV